MTRRIVTKIDKNGRSKIISDAVVTNVEIPLPDISKAFKFHNLWITDTMPVQDNENDDPVANQYISTTPPQNGSLFRIVDYPPEDELLKKVKEMSKDELVAFSEQVGVRIDLDASHPFMHTTETIDFGIVLSGEIYLVLDDEETLLHPGDVVVQRGTNHAWSNRSDKSCQMAFVLLDGHK